MLHHFGVDFRPKLGDVVGVMQLLCFYSVYSPCEVFMHWCRGTGVSGIFAG